MRLAGTDDTDIRLDLNGQPIPDNNGNCMLVTGQACWMQDIWLEMMTDEGELLHEDEEGRMAYGYSLTDFLSATYSDELEGELRQQIMEKLTKRSYIDEGSIGIAFAGPELHECQWAVHLEFRELGAEDGLDVDVYADGKEVYVT